MQFFRKWLLTPLLIVLAWLLWQWYQTPNFGNGQKAAEFAAPVIVPQTGSAWQAGDTLRLSSLAGGVVLLDFWGSWCGPCRHSSPMLRRLHAEYGALGLKIVLIGIDSDKGRFLSAFKSDGLTEAATAVSHFQRFKDPVASLYGVKAIPTSFLIDQNGVIVGVSLTEGKLREQLHRLLKK